MNLIASPRAVSRALAPLGVAVALALAVPAGVGTAQAIGPAIPAPPFKPGPVPAIFTSATGLEVLQAEHSTAAEPQLPNEAVELLSARFQSVQSADLLIRFDAECAVWTDTRLDAEVEGEAGNGEDGTLRSDARLHVWIEVDGKPLPMANDSVRPSAIEEPHEGSVAFCNGAIELAFDDLDDQAYLAAYERSRSLDGFKWAGLNIARGTHEIKVMARLDAEVHADADDPEAGAGAAASVRAQAIVGKRNLQVLPVRMALNGQL